jgi:putative colanic acid biosynthesis glycosyltransferase
MKQPLVSIIIPVFNAQTTLSKTIDSVTGQSYKNLELILIDGGSTDGTLNIIESYKSVITYYSSEKDAGVYDAMNKGIDRANGDWIYILGSDDELYSNDVIENVMDRDLSEVRLIFGNVINTEKEHRIVPQIHRSSIGWQLIFRNTIHQQSAFYHRTLFEETKFNTDYRVLSDYAFHIGLWRKGVSSLYLDKTIAKCKAQGLSKNFSWPLYEEEIRMKRHTKTGIPAWIRFAIYPISIAKFLLKKTL